MKSPTLSRSPVSRKQGTRIPTNTYTLCLVESNGRAAENLAEILSEDPNIDACFFDRFVSVGTREIPVIFCLDQEAVWSVSRGMLRVHPELTQNGSPLS